MASIYFRCWHQAIGIHTNDGEVLERLCAYLPPGGVPCAARETRHHYRVDRLPTGAYHVRDGHRLLGVAPDAESACEGLEGELNLLVAELCPSHVFVHAGVVEWGGRAIVLPGRSFSGKSSLVAALVRAGAAYASDEFAPIDSDGRVHPFPRRIKLRRPHQRHAERVTPAGRRVAQALPISLIVSTRFVEGARWEPRPLPWGRAMLAMIANTVPVRTRPHQALPFIGAALMGARALEGVRGEADEAAQAILRAAESTPPLPGSRG